MKKLRLAIIGQGRSGRDIHGKFYKSEQNLWFDVAYVVELDPERRERAQNEYPGCCVLEDYRDLFKKTDIDLVVNDTYSDTHYSITKELLLNGFNVLVEKPFARTYYECADLIRIAKEKGLLLCVFQQSFLAPYYLKAKEIVESGVLGDIKQVNVQFNGFSRRWDWQTLQSKVAGGVYNTGPHPIGLALGFLDFDPNTRVEYSKLDIGLTSGDSDDYAKIVLSAPGKPVVDVEVSSLDAFSDYKIKIQGSRGTLKSGIKDYKMKYIVDGENPERPVIFESLKNDERLPMYCSEQLVAHEEEGKIGGSAFSEAVCSFYEDVYKNLTGGAPMRVTAEMAAMVISVIEIAHAQNPLPVKY